MNIAARLNAERVVLFGWSRAILLQLAHPLIAAGVAEHSTFRRDPLTAAARLHHTIRAMLALTFGDETRRAAAIDGISAIHRRVHGYLPHDVGPFPAGTYYSAEDPDLLLWVHATLLDSIPLIYTLLVAPLTEKERDAYCVEAAPVAIDLGARSADVPRTWSDLQTYLTGMYASGRIAVGPQARELAAAVLTPGHRAIAVGLLPADVRAQYGYTWDARRERRLQTTLRVIRTVRAVMPKWVAYWGDAR